MIPQILAGSFLLGQYAYHRWQEHKRDHSPRQIRVEIPRTEEGATIPMLFGTCKVTTPIVAWTYVYSFSSVDDARMNILLVLGFGMSTVRIKRMWGGDYLMYGPGAPGWTGVYQNGTGGPETPLDVFAAGGQGTGAMETLNGNASQVLCNDGETTANAVTYAGRRMLGVMSEDEISGYRGYASVFLFGTTGNEWVVPAGPVPAYSFEVETYDVSHAQLGTYGRVGADINPINAIFNILTGTHGKLGLSEDAIDISNFRSAQYKLHTETHGYSRAVNDTSTAEDLLQSILEQIDGVLDIDLQTGKLVIKLIRNDYDPTTIPHITKDNCVDIVNFTIGTMSNTPNRVRVTFTEREPPLPTSISTTVVRQNYAEGSAVESTMATAVGQNGVTREVVINYPGVSNRALAARLAARELAARNRNIIKCRALVDRSFYNITRGTAVKVTWQKPDIAGLIFRVANVDRGTQEDGKIALDLISDVFFTYRDRTPRPLPELKFKEQLLGIL